MTFFFIVMFLILWAYLGINSAFVGSLIAYVFLLYSPNRANLYLFALYCLLYIIAIVVIPQSLTHKFFAIASGIIVPIVAWSIGEMNYKGQINNFLNIRQLEQQSNELSFAYNDIN